LLPLRVTNEFGGTKGGTFEPLLELEVALRADHGIPQTIDMVGHDVPSYAGHSKTTGIIIA
jgi:hypothetical protein